jgi:hypothetical protein
MKKLMIVIFLVWFCCILGLFGFLARLLLASLYVETARDPNCRQDISLSFAKEFNMSMKHPRAFCAKPAILFLLMLCASQTISAAAYYIDYSSGLDANSGTSKSTPWKRCPGMQGFAGTYNHAAGDQFIFKGGVTWAVACLPLAIVNSGSSGSSDYYGVDLTWYSGGTWARPIFDGSYARTNIVDLGSLNYVTVDNIELCHVTFTASNLSGIVQVAGTHILIENCYVHGWTSGKAVSGSFGGIIGNNNASSCATIVIDKCEVENSEIAVDTQCGECVHNVGTIRNSKIHDNCSGVVFCVDFNGNQLYNLSGDNWDHGTNAHYNGIYMDPWRSSISTGYIRNSYIHDCLLGSNMAYPNVRGGCSIYVYNNVFYGGMSAQRAINIDPAQYASEGPGNCYIWNNTIVPVDSNSVAIHVTNRGSSQPVNALVIDNNQIIGIGNSVTDGIAGSGGDVNTLQVGAHNLIQTPSVASAQGYTLGNLYAPTAGGFTIDAGASEAAYFTSDILGVSRPQGLAWDIGAYESMSSGQILAPNAPKGLRIKQN